MNCYFARCSDCVKNPSQKFFSLGQLQNIWLRVSGSHLHLGQFLLVPGNVLASLLFDRWSLCQTLNWRSPYLMQIDELSTQKTALLHCVIERPKPSSVSHCCLICSKEGVVATCKSSYIADTHPLCKGSACKHSSSQLHCRFEEKEKSVF